ncbi:hypothetical protein F5I97DRAFT_1894403 [Phlebopus sp. FC_14]|nr:hypothetical protein F5I97DRAFT_1894403 [Phlebopus sp. FC_14]
MSRRMDISSLLCRVDPPTNSVSPVDNPVNLAPDLRGRHTHQHRPQTTTDDLASPSSHIVRTDRDYSSPHMRDTKQPSHGYADRRNTIDALLHHPPAQSRPSDYPSSSPTASLLSHRQHSSPDAQSPSSSAASYSPTTTRDNRPLEKSVNANKPSLAPSLPYTYASLRSSPEILAQSQHRALSSSVPHPYSPVDMVQHIHTSYQATARAAAPMSPMPTLIAPRVSASASEPASSMQTQSSPFSGFEALVHAASEERRRITAAGVVVVDGEREGWRERQKEQLPSKEQERNYRHRDQSPTTSVSPLHDRPSTSTSRHHSHAPTVGSFPYPQSPVHLHSPRYSPSHSQQLYPMQTNSPHSHSATSFEDESRPHKRRRAAYSPPRSQSPSRSRSSSDLVTASLAGDSNPSNQFQTPNSTHATTRRHAEPISRSPSASMRSSRMASIADHRDDGRADTDASSPFPPPFVPTSPSPTPTSTPQSHPHTSTYVQNQPHHLLHAAVPSRHSPNQHSHRPVARPSPQYSPHPHSPPKHFQHLRHPRLTPPFVDSHQMVGSTNSLGLELPSGKLVMREESPVRYKARQQEGGERLDEQLSRKQALAQVQVPVPQLAGAEWEDEDEGLSASYTWMQSAKELNRTAPLGSQAHHLLPSSPKPSRKRKSMDYETQTRPDFQLQTSPQYDGILQPVTSPLHALPASPERTGNEYAVRDEAKWNGEGEHAGGDEEIRDTETREGIDGDAVPLPSPARSPPLLATARPVTLHVLTPKTEWSPSVFLAQEEALTITLVPEDDTIEPPSQVHLDSRLPDQSRPSPSTPVRSSPTVKIEPELPTTQLSSPQLLSPQRSREKEVLHLSPVIASPEEQRALLPGSRPGTPQSIPGRYTSDVVQSKAEQESSLLSSGIVLGGPLDGKPEAISDSPQDVVPEIQPKLEPIRSPPGIRAQTPSNMCLATPTREETRSISDDSSIPELHSSRPFHEPLPSREPESALEVTQSQPSIMDVDEELLSLVEDGIPRHRSSPVSGPSQIFEAPAKSVSPLASQATPPPRSPAILVDEEKDRASMPPPAPRMKKGERIDNDIPGGSKKKDGTSKPSAKHKQPTKPRTKPPPKMKAKSNDFPSQKDSASKGALALKSGVSANARSRSASVIPVGDEAADIEADDSEKEDDKLYCVCNARYDEDKMMIACDRCDEWYHTQCVHMSDLEIDLVDQFICPPCLQKLPHLHTTWKRRCLFGLKHDDPCSPSACHKPSRGAFSKYCSDECGIKYMQSRITEWERSGGKRDLLWETVKGAEKRQGVVVRAGSKGPNEHDTFQHHDTDGREPDPVDAAAKRRAEREIARLNTRLVQVVKEREMTKREIDTVLWREKVVDLASKRAERVDECGWDQRLCFGEEEWVDFGAEVLESYEEEKGRAESGDEADTNMAVSHGEWWCTGKKRCDRHAGWQKLRTAEVSFEKEMKEGLLLKLTTREREIRKAIEDMLYPQSSTASQTPRTAVRLEVQLNGSNQSRTNGDISERMKKKP